MLQHVVHIDNTSL